MWAKFLFMCKCLGRLWGIALYVFIHVQYLTLYQIPMKLNFRCFVMTCSTNITPELFFKICFNLFCRNYLLSKNTRLHYPVFCLREHLCFLTNATVRRNTTKRTTVAIYSVYATRNLVRSSLFISSNRRKTTQTN